MNLFKNTLFLQPAFWRKTTEHNHISFKFSASTKFNYTVNSKGRWKEFILFLHKPKEKQGRTSRGHLVHPAVPRQDQLYLCYFLCLSSMFPMFCDKRDSVASQEIHWTASQSSFYHILLTNNSISVWQLNPLLLIVADYSPSFSQCLLYNWSLLLCVPSVSCFSV